MQFIRNAWPTVVIVGTITVSAWTAAWNVRDFITTQLATQIAATEARLATQLAATETRVTARTTETEARLAQQIAELRRLLVDHLADHADPR